MVGLGGGLRSWVGVRVLCVLSLLLCVLRVLCFDGGESVDDVFWQLVWL